MKILNKCEPIIDPCGTSNLGSNDFPNDEKFLISVSCLYKFRRISTESMSVRIDN